MAAATTQIRPYQTYTQSGVKNPQIQSLESRVEELINRIRSEEGRWFWRDADTIEALKERADFLLTQRDELNRGKY